MLPLVLTVFSVFFADIFVANFFQQQLLHGVLAYVWWQAFAPPRERQVGCLAAGFIALCFENSVFLSRWGICLVYLLPLVALAPQVQRVVRPGRLFLASAGLVLSVMIYDFLIKGATLDLSIAVYSTLQSVFATIIMMIITLKSLKIWATWGNRSASC